MKSIEFFMLLSFLHFAWYITQIHTQEKHCGKNLPRCHDYDGKKGIGVLPALCVMLCGGVSECKVMRKTEEDNQRKKKKLFAFFVVAIISSCPTTHKKKKISNLTCPILALFYFDISLSGALHLITESKKYCHLTLIMYTHHT